MPWKLIGTIALLAGGVAFIGFNLGNAADVSFGFAVLPQVPVFLVALVSFTVGMVAALPLALGRPRRDRAAAGKSRSSGKALAKRSRNALESDEGAYGID